jgi:hypothetical protein
LTSSSTITACELRDMFTNSEFWAMTIFMALLLFAAGTLAVSFCVFASQDGGSCWVNFGRWHRLQKWRAERKKQAETKEEEQENIEFEDWMAKQEEHKSSVDLPSSSHAAMTTTTSVTVPAPAPDSEEKD